jgi:uncharacterized membrane protein YedE/YeeE
MATVVERRGAAGHGSAPLVTAALLTLAGTLTAQLVSGPRMAALFLIGALLGLSLYHASFGFTAAWRRFAVTGDGAGLRAQMLMLAAAVLLFFPALAAGQVWGQPVGGFVAPAGVSVIVGAFIFGVGMQLGGGCASGTLFTLGGGSTRMVLVLFFFIVGSVIATAHLPFWFALPALRPTSLVHELGLATALLLNLGLFAAIATATLVIERRRGFVRAPAAAADWLRGPWPLLAGALALALLNFATLLLAGRPWGITSAFALWGAKGLDAAGVDIAAWPHWQPQAAALAASVWTDITSVMNFGIVVGAFAAAALAGRFAPTLRLTRSEIWTAVVGGLLLGYGARLAFGCNIGAFFSGVASGSLHGWLWLVCAFAGSWLGTRLRPLCGLPRA